MKEAKFLAGLFLEFEIPSDKLFLLKYFQTDLEVQFLRYYFCFQETEYFVDHTGFYCQKRWVKILEKRLNLLIGFYNHCKKNFDTKKLAEIEMGKIKLGDINKYAMEYK